MSRLDVGQPMRIINRTLVTYVFQLAQTAIAQYTHYSVRQKQHTACCIIIYYH